VKISDGDAIRSHYLLNLFRKNKKDVERHKMATLMREKMEMEI
jgi:hypothetical protein